MHYSTLLLFEIAQSQLVSLLYIQVAQSIVEKVKLGQITGEKYFVHIRKLFKSCFKLQICCSPVSILSVVAGSPIKAGVTGIGGAELVGLFPGSTATHSQGCHLYRD